MKVLFVSEAVTLAQVARLTVLAKSLPAENFEVHFASAQFDPLLFGDSTFRRWPIQSVSSTFVLEATESGRRIYDDKTLAAYVQDDVALIEKVKPDLIVGDLRLSLAVSAPLMKTPYAALANSYWKRGKFPMPDHPTVKWLGHAIASAFYPLARPTVFRYFAAPINRLRKKHGLSSIGSLEDVLTFGDYTLFADIPMLTGWNSPASNEMFLGPVIWSPRGALPEWWDATAARPLAYLTLGSSGKLDTIFESINGLKRAGFAVMVATADRFSPREIEDVWFTPYLPGDLAARRSSLVVCNGGSTTAYQALNEGIPVLGMPSNLDQHLSMQGIVEMGAGIKIRDFREVESSAKTLIDDKSYSRSAGKVAGMFREFTATERFGRFLSRLTTT